MAPVGDGERWLRVYVSQSYQNGVPVIRRRRRRRRQNDGELTDVIYTLHQKETFTISTHSQSVQDPGVQVRHIFYTRLLYSTDTIIEQ